ncbi:hypothetical protein CSC70_08760 [Pseudoxanthomonas kalamensis DSM 18571]|uniref:hypothetical protein n=1 Tax=Pseudoxanthomonas kalamensis TaxID=289483 RepID=UPI0013913610|nr:hypothetical protein [Pseudoxanthomonas kalamensis]KAF1709779.1 hypothetical protein CSC70_08760 [Pseudoxanthomonas kalamensis DSM 18571]
MRTLILILIGLAVAAVSMWLGGPGRRRWAFAGFAVAWLLVVGWNLRTGLSHGYSLAEEAPIQTLIYLLPVALAALLAWKLPGK